MPIDKFITYLKAVPNVQLLDPTNKYEVVRFRTCNGVSVVYQKQNGQLTFTGEAKEAYDKFKKKNVWTVVSTGLKEKKRLKKEIIERDGINCFYCGRKTPEDNRTIEHILSIEHGGNNNINNLALSCQGCNLAVGSMAVVEKIAYRDTLREDKS